MNKELDKKIERLEALKNKELMKIQAINEVVASYDGKLKVLYDYKKQQEKIFQMQKDLDLKIKEQNNE